MYKMPKKIVWKDIIIFTGIIGVYMMGYFIGQHDARQIDDTDCSRCTHNLKVCMDILQKPDNTIIFELMYNVSIDNVTGVK